MNFAVSLIMVSQAVGYNTQIVPEYPTSCDIVVITLSGDWGSSCTPNASAISVAGNDIYFNVIWDYPPGVGCLTVITPWERIRSVGPLSPGTYTVYARIVGYPIIPETYTPMTEFTITPESHIDTVYYVDAATGNNNNDGLSKDTAFATIQKGVDTAKSGDTIIVAEGTYTGYGNHDINFYCKAITVRCTDPNNPNIVANTVVDCNGTGSGFNFKSNEGQNSVLDGITITNGFIGINCRDYSSPTINHCLIVHNCTSPFSVGIRCNNSSPNIINCIVSGNCSGIYASYNSNLTITKCIIEDNVGAEHGGGIYCRASNPKLINCTIRGNSARFYGGGILVGDSNIVITNCTINDNVANWGGGGLNSSGSNMTITNCTFTANSSGNGNAVQCSSVHNNPSDVNISNCIFWDGGDEIQNNDGSRIIVTYSDAQGGWPGLGNIDTDPFFADDANGEYHLSESSSCINAGDPNYVPEPNETDLDGWPRIIGDRIDMGAYEFNHQPIADAGPDQTVYAWIDGIADVNLDGSGSYDADGDELTYSWSWTIDGNTCEANDVKPSIELPVGQHTIQLIVNDGLIDSEPNEVNIIVVGPIEANLFVMPKVLNCKNPGAPGPRIMAMMRLPKGITKNQIDANEPIMLYPGEIEADKVLIIKGFNMTIFASFDKDELMNVIDANGLVEIAVVGRLKTGQYFFGTDDIRVICPGRWPRHRSWFNLRRTCPP